MEFVFAWHLVCWMILGMVTNYYWDLFNLGKGIASMQVPRIVLPLMVSPFVFLPTVQPLAGFQFAKLPVVCGDRYSKRLLWQALFTKLSPLERASTIPWTVGSNRGGTKATGSGQDAM